MKTSIGERLKNILKAQGMNMNQLAVKMHVSNSNITRKVKNPKLGMTLKTIQAIYEAIPEMNLEYFVMDRGEMFINPNDKSKEIITKDEKIKSLQLTIIDKDKTIKYQDKTLQDKEKIIELLDDKLKHLKL